MRSSTVSAPVQSCSATLTPSSKKYAAVELLTRQTLYFIVEVSHCSSPTPPNLSLVKEPECESTRFPLLSSSGTNSRSLPNKYWGRVPSYHVRTGNVTYHLQIVLRLRTRGTLLPFTMHHQTMVLRHARQMCREKFEDFRMVLLDSCILGCNTVSLDYSSQRLEGSCCHHLQGQAVEDSPKMKALPSLEPS